jgi:hypothetical protein
MHQQSPTKTVFMTQEAILEAIDSMENNHGLDTKSRPAKGVLLSSDLPSFRETHLLYLKEHPKVNPAHYLSNLKAMIKIR